MPERPGLYKSTHDTKMNTEVEFSCANGNTLLGAHRMVCLPSGNWSAPMPLCETIGEHLRPVLRTEPIGGCPAGGPRGQSVCSDATAPLHPTPTRFHCAWLTVCARCGCVCQAG